MSKTANKDKSTKEALKKKDEEVVKEVTKDTKNDKKHADPAKEVTTKASTKDSTKESTKKEPTKELTKEPTKESTKKDTSKETTKEAVKDVADSDEAPNNATKKAGLRLDVNTRRKWLKKYLTRYPLPKIESVTNTDGKNSRQQARDADGNLIFEYANVSGAQYALASIEQDLISALVRVAFAKAPKTKVGIYEINYSLLRDSLTNDTELNAVFGQFLQNYDANADYFSQLFSEKNTEVATFVEKQSLDNACAQLTIDGMNFLCFVLQKNRSFLSDCAIRLVKYAKKKTVCEEAILVAVEDRYNRAPNLCSRMLKKFESVAYLVEEAQKEERSKKADKEATKATTKETEVKVKETEVKSDKKANKKVEVPKPKVETESDSSDSDSDDN